MSIETTVQLNNGSVADKTSKIWKIPVSSRIVFDTFVPTAQRNMFDVTMLNDDKLLLSDDKHDLRIKFETNSMDEFAIQLGYDMSPMNMNVGVVYGGAILILLYGLIIFEVWNDPPSLFRRKNLILLFHSKWMQIVHRTFAAVTSSILAVAALALLNDRPTMSDIVTYMDMEALLLMFSMMLVVAVLTETGVFDYLAYYAFKVYGATRRIKSPSSGPVTHLCFN